MIVTAMQPYFFPYIGYFQLLVCSDIFVVADDYKYIKKGWVNRNRILINHQPSWLIFPVRKGSLDLPINQRYYVEGLYQRHKMLRSIEEAYRRAPCFKEIYPVIEDLMSFGSNNVGEFNTNTIRRLSELLEIDCEIVQSSGLNINPSLKCQDRAIEINRCLGSNHYINPIGGSALYEEHSFNEHGIELSFLQSDDISYYQFSESFSPCLSIIDVLMFCSLDEIKMLLKQFRLIKQTEIIEKLELVYE